MAVSPHPISSSESTPTDPFTQRARLRSQTGASLPQRQQQQQQSPPPLPPVQPWVFQAERQQAFDPALPSQLIPLDRSDHLQLPYPATTPSLLAAYLKVNAQDILKTCCQGSLECYFVIRGAGSTDWGEAAIQWQSGDVFFLPGGYPIKHQAYSEDCLLYVVSDQPLAQFLQLTAAETSRFLPIHYRGNDLQRVQAESLQSNQDSGVIHFCQDDQVVYSSFLPAWKWIVPGEHQCPHRHASVAVQLFIAGGHSYSIIDGKRVDWEAYTVAISPAGSLHSHHNEGDDLGIYLVVQDFSLHKYLRTYWYEESEIS